MFRTREIRPICDGAAYEKPIFEWLKYSIAPHQGTDNGIWRRIKLIPFTTTIPAEKQDKHLDQKLLEEGLGILNWLIEGTRRWFADGLVSPPAISSATEEYRNEMDVLGLL
ncbi:hypothetical protein FACS189494_10400 [Spirochaetia bacterium]|nr:hypothetical protein FACS189494_10400 [Spirochaetia bacterium]